MNSMEGTVKVDMQGKVRIPKRMQDISEISSEDIVKIMASADGIFLKAAEKKCTLCGSCQNIKAFKGKYVCLNCRNEAARMIS